MKYPIVKFMLAAIFVLMAQTFPVFSENQRADDRYSLTETDNGFVRLDRKTGSVSICTTVGSGLKCRLGADERSAYQQELASIKSTLARLQKRLDVLEARNQTPGKKAGNEEEEFDRALKFADKAFRHFFGLMQELKQEPKKDAI